MRLSLREVNYKIYIYIHNVRQQYADAYHGNIRASDTKNFQHLTAPSGSYCVSHRGDKLFQNNFLIYNSPRRKNVLCLLFYISAQKKYINSDIHAINDLIISEQFHCRVGIHFFKILLQLYKT